MADFRTYISSDGSVVTFDINNEYMSSSGSVRSEYLLEGVTAALTGTITASIDEDDITTGGNTIIITLVGDTWKTAGTGPIGSTADTQALIDGFDAASSPTNGWNNEVRDKALTSEIVRTSATVATWTVSAQAGYDISAQEIVTGTIPTAALTTGAGALTAVPTFTIDEVVASGAFTLVAETDSYIYSGTDASTLLSALLAGETAQYTYSGTDADLVTGKSLEAETAQYAYSGTDADLNFFSAGNFTLDAETAQYTYSGTNADLLLSANLDAETAQYTYAGQDATLTRNFSITGETAQYTYSGTDAALVTGTILVTETAQYSYSGTDLSLNISGRVVIGVTMYPSIDNRNMILNAENRTMIIN